MSTYQPLWLDGRTVGDSKRDAVTRYEAIAAHVKHLPDGFKAVDVGAHSGYFSYRMADELGAHVTAIDGDDALRVGVAQMEVGRTVASRVQPDYRNLNAGELPKLGPFDVGLCLSVLHHLPWWRDMVDDMLNACALVFFEVAVPGENLAWISDRTGPTSRYVAALPGARKICEVPGFDDRYPRPTYMVPGRGTGTIPEGVRP